jgi:YARHG domain
VAAGGAVSTLPAGAMADDAADGLSCHDLWVMRNQVYKDHGYCFKTEKARTYFGNGGCYSTMRATCRCRGRSGSS